MDRKILSPNAANRLEFDDAAGLAAAAAEADAFVAALQAAWEAAPAAALRADAARALADALPPGWRVRLAAEPILARELALFANTCGAWVRPSPPPGFAERVASLACRQRLLEPKILGLPRRAVGWAAGLAVAAAVVGLALGPTLAPPAGDSGFAQSDGPAAADHPPLPEMLQEAGAATLSLVGSGMPTTLAAADAGPAPPRSAAKRSFGLARLPMSSGPPLALMSPPAPPLQPLQDSARGAFGYLWSAAAAADSANAGLPAGGRGL